MNGCLGRSQHRFLVSQCLSVHGFCVFILALAGKDQSKVIDAGECVWMLGCKARVFKNQASAIGSLMSMTVKSYLSTEHKKFSQKLKVLATIQEVLLSACTDLLRTTKR